MINSTTTLEKIISVINGNRSNLVQDVVNEYKLDYGIQHFFGQSHIRLLMFGQLAECSSLQEIVCKASNNEKIRRIANVPSVSQFSRQNKKRDAEFAEQLFYKVLKKARAQIGWKRFEEIKHKLLSNLGITAMDSSVVNIATRLCEELHFQKKKSGIRINTLYNINQKLPVRVRITPRKESEASKKNLENLLETKEIIALMDRGFTNYRLYDKLTNKKTRFINRINKAKRYKLLKEKTLDNKDITDYLVELGTGDMRLSTNID
jgi:hypothetical protein